MFRRCYRCFKPVKVCLCDQIKPVKTNIKFIILMHPKEAYQQKTGTGRLTGECLVDSEILIGIDFTQNSRLNALLDPSYDDGKYQPFLLYPDKEAWHTEKPGFKEMISGKIPLIILVDATWFFAKKMIKLSDNLHALPKLSFSLTRIAQNFMFKRQPSPECLSTIESAYYLIEEFQSKELITECKNYTCLMQVFRSMVKYQLDCEQTRNEILAKEMHPELFQR